MVQDVHDNPQFPTNTPITPSSIIDALNQLPNDKQQAFITGVMGDLSSDQKSSMVRYLVSSSSPDDSKNVAKAAMDPLNPQQKKEVADQSGLRPPDNLTSNTLWLVVIFSFALVFIISAVSIAYAILFQGQANKDLQMLLTIFTSVSGFLAGLLIPGPNSKTQNTQANQ